MAVFCSSGVPRKSRPGPMQAQTLPQTSLFLSSSRRTWAGSICDGSSTGISTVSKPHFLKVGNNFVLALVNGDVNRNVLIPSLIKLWVLRAQRLRNADEVSNLLRPHRSAAFRPHQR